MIRVRVISETQRHVCLPPETVTLTWHRVSLWELNELQARGATSLQTRCGSSRCVCAPCASLSGGRVRKWKIARKGKKGSTTTTIAFQIRRHGAAMQQRKLLDLFLQEPHFNSIATAWRPEPQTEHVQAFLNHVRESNVSMMTETCMPAFNRCVTVHCCDSFNPPGPQRLTMWACAGWVSPQRPHGSSAAAQIEHSQNVAL